MRLTLPLIAASALALAACAQDDTSADNTPAASKASWQDTLLLDTSANAAPGAFYIFLSDGTLMQGACANPYRVSQWSGDGDDGAQWSEDGREITATISASGSGYTLDFTSDEGLADRTLELSQEASVCPDLPF